jgi:hypothetical protein
VTDSASSAPNASIQLITINECELRRAFATYVEYCVKSRTHFALNNNAWSLVRAPCLLTEKSSQFSAPARHHATNAAARNARVAYRVQQERTISSNTG